VIEFGDGERVFERQRWCVWPRLGDFGLGFGCALAFGLRSGRLRGGISIGKLRVH
jgi:hypothetical protein